MHGKNKQTLLCVHKDKIKQSVIEFVNSGNTKAEAARKFNVPSQTVSRWTLK